MDAVETVGGAGRGVNPAGDGISGTGWDDGAGNGGHGKMQIGGGPELTAQRAVRADAQKAIS